MKLQFRPYPILTVITLIAISILISLGTWQYHRLQWKTALLAEIDVASQANPFTTIAEIEAAFNDDTPIDYRRVAMPVTVTPYTRYHVFTPFQNTTGWRVFAPVKHEGHLVFAALGTRTDADKNGPITSYEAPTMIAGYVRRARKPGWLSTQSTPEKNRWFHFNPMPETQPWNDPSWGEIHMDYYIDTVPGGADMGMLPVKQPVIANNHFDYMLTWYGLAVVLLVFYGLIHRRDGRLKWS